MYTLEEIKKESNAYKWKYWRWCFFVSLILAAFIFFILLPVMIDSYKPHGDNFFFYFQFLMIFIVIILIWSLPGMAYNYKKKQLEEENAAEEREQREEYYKRMESMYKQITKEMGK